MSGNALLLTARRAAAVRILGMAWAFSSLFAWHTCQSSVAATYTYTPVNSTTDVWSAGTDWNATPVSDPSTELTFVGNNGTVLPSGLNNTNTDDIAGPLSLSILGSSAEFVGRYMG